MGKHLSQQALVSATPEGVLNEDMNIKDTLIASLVPIFLGFGFVIAKPAFESFPPILLMGIRFMFAASILIW